MSCSFEHNADFQMPITRKPLLLATENLDIRYKIFIFNFESMNMDVWIRNVDEELSMACLCVYNNIPFQLAKFVYYLYLK